ncbi:Cell division cycle-associated 7-like protein [Actinidia chinensis var. chinensis]|uniref:Cell division cycle-associated 7-like protein n=1 Tax=Actinidia chinensis var. chinensis TaxID=1590841 RepID=A0A2R6RBZ4_ACTCC|nr:Cell division cycle-associated 7-like protein [Actinidia chinensis var. chinensis]
MARQSKRDRTQKNKDEVSGYEQFRDQRIRENMERMQKLGILDLSRKLKSESHPQKRPKRNPCEKKPSIDPPRRSSRLGGMTRVSYADRCTPKKEKVVKFEEIHIKEGSKPEIYTEEDEKLLGDCKTAWVLLVDGYNADGERIYDTFYGKSCHQCRKLLAIVPDAVRATQFKASFVETAYTPDMGRMFWKHTKTRVGFALYAEEFVTAAVVDGQKDGNLRVLSTERLQNLASSLWHTISFILVDLRQSRKKKLLKIQFLLVNHPLQT